MRRKLLDVGHQLVPTVVLSCFGVGVALIVIEVRHSVLVAEGDLCWWIRDNILESVRWESLADMAGITSPLASQCPVAVLTMELGIMDFGVE